MKKTGHTSKRRQRAIDDSIEVLVSSLPEDERMKTRTRQKPNTMADMEEEMLSVTHREIM